MDDRWYSSEGWLDSITQYGSLAVSAETVMRCSTVLAAVRFRGDALSMCPPCTYIKQSDGQRVEDPTHYSQRVLRNPNAWQTGNRWRHLVGVHMATWGNAYSRIITRRQFAEELHPLYPGLVRIIEQRSDGTLLYEYRPKGKPAEYLGSEHMLHIRDIGTDGFRGLPMYQLIRNVVSIALLAERHEETFLKKGTRVSGLIMTSGTMNTEQRKDLRESINSDFGGASQTGTLGILPPGVDVKPLTLGARVEQRAELTDQNIGSILRFMGVPGVVVGWQGDKASTYASAEAFFEKGGIKHCVLPIVMNVESEAEKSLLPANDQHFIRFNLDALLRASWKDRIDGLVKAAGGPILTVNEGRQIEDYPRLDDPRFDTVHVPSNMSGAEKPEAHDPSAARPAPAPYEDPEPDDARRQLPAPAAAEPTITVYNPALTLARRYAHDNAARLVRYEVATIKAKAPKLAKEPRDWRAFVLETYGKHVAHVAETMRITESEAKAYCDAQAAELLAGGVAAAEAWEKTVPQRLAAVALRGVAA